MYDELSILFIKIVKREICQSTEFSNVDKQIVCNSDLLYINLFRIKILDFLSASIEYR